MQTLSRGWPAPSPTRFLHPPRLAPNPGGAISKPPASYSETDLALVLSDNDVPLSRTTLGVVALLMTGDLLKIRSHDVADQLQISATTLRRRLRLDGYSYQMVLDSVRQHRCKNLLANRWLPGKSLAWELGYMEVNSFYRAFQRWTGARYSEAKAHYL